MVLSVWGGVDPQDQAGEGAAELENMHSDRLKVLQLDVCSDEQVSKAVEFIRANLENPEKGENAHWLPGANYVRAEW